MEVTDTAIPGVKVLTPRKHADERGAFTETYSRRSLAGAGIVVEFVQDNAALSHEKGTVRGLHFQIPPSAQAKLVRVVRGAIFDVCVDIRHGSPTFGAHVSQELSAENGTQIFVPEGFAHGYCTLLPGTEVAYKVSAHHAPDLEGGILWCDPDLGIKWPVGPEEAILSERDQRWPAFSGLPQIFATTLE